MRSDTLLELRGNVAEKKRRDPRRTVRRKSSLAVGLKGGMVPRWRRTRRLHRWDESAERSEAVGVRGRERRTVRT